MRQEIDREREARESEIDRERQEREKEMRRMREKNEQDIADLRNKLSQASLMTPQVNPKGDIFLFFFKSLNTISNMSLGCCFFLNSLAYFKIILMSQLIEVIFHSQIRRQHSFTSFVRSAIFTIYLLDRMKVSTKMKPLCLL